MMKIKQRMMRLRPAMVRWGMFVAAFLGGCGPVLAQELQIQPAAQSALQEALHRPLKKFGLNQKGADDIAGAIEAWVGKCMDLGTAKPRQSQLYPGGITYVKQGAKNVPIFADEGAASGEGRETGNVDIFYRKSAHRFYFHKFMSVGTAAKLDPNMLIERASRFLENNKFVRFTEADKWGEMRVAALNTNEDAGPDTAGREVFNMQRVKFRRFFDGLPVANSAISVDFHPETGEVLGLKHYHWTPVDEAIGAEAPKLTLEDVQRNLTKKVQSMGIGLERAMVENIRLCWFETQKDLVPVLMCGVKIAPPEGTNVQPVQIVEYINLAGSDDDLILQKRTAGAKGTATLQDMK